MMLMNTTRTRRVTPPAIAAVAGGVRLVTFAFRGAALTSI